MKRHQISMFISLAIAFFITQVTGTLYLAAMPSLVTYFASTQAGVMLMLSYMFVFYALGQIVWGPMSDRYGRRITILSSLALYIVISLIIPFCHHLESFRWLYGLLGFAAAAYTSVGNATIKDNFGDNTKKIVSYIGIVMASGPLVGPLLGGQLVHFFNWHGVAVFLTLTAILNFILCYAFLPKDKSCQMAHLNNSNHLSAALRHILINREYIRYVVILALSFGGFYSMLDIAPFIFKDYLHMNTEQFSFWFTLLASSYFFGAIVTSAITAKHATKKIVKTAIAFILAGTALFIIMTLTQNYQFSLMGTAIAIIMWGFGMCVPACKGGILMSVSAHNGMAASIMKLIQSATATLMITLGTTLYSNATLSHYVAMLIVMSVVCVGIFLMPHTLNANRLSQTA